MPIRYDNTGVDVQGYRSDLAQPREDVYQGRMPGDAGDRLDYFRRRLTNMKRNREDWEGHWRDLAENILPYEERFLTPNQGNPSMGGKRNNYLVDTTGKEAASMCAIGLTNGLVPRSTAWLQLTLGGNAGLLEFGPVKQWFYDTTQAMLEIYQESNFYQLIESFFLDCAVFGPACLYFERHPTNVVNFTKLHIGEYWLGQDNYGMINACYRQFWATPRQLAEKFGVKNLTQATYSKLQAGQDDTYIKCYQCVEMNPNYRRQYLGERVPWYHKRYSSVYFEDSAKRGVDTKNGQGEPDEKIFLSEGGYDYFPFFIVPWDDTNGLYGRSLGMDALPNILGLQSLKEDRYDIAAKKSNPPLLTAASNKGNIFNLQAGGISYLDTLSLGGNQLAMPLQSFFGDATDAQILAEEDRASINRIFMVDYLLTFLNSDKTNMTAYEAAQRNAEKQSVVAPLASRFAQRFNPVHEAVFRFGLEDGRIRRMPPELEEAIFSGSPINIIYTSDIALAQKATQFENMRQLIAFAAEIAGSVDPSAALKINGQQAIDETKKMFNVPGNIIKDDAEVAAIEQAQAEQQEQMQQMEMMKEGSKAVKNASAAAGDGSIMNMFNQAMQGAGTLSGGGM